MMGGCSAARFLMKVFFFSSFNQTLLHKSPDGIFYQSASCYEQQGQRGDRRIFFHFNQNLMFSFFIVAAKKKKKRD